MRGRGVKLSREVKNFFIFVIISLVFLGLDSWGFLGLPRDVFETVFNPIKRGAYLVSSHSNIILGMVFNIEDTFFNILLSSLFLTCNSPAVFKPVPFIFLSTSCPS